MESILSIDVEDWFHILDLPTAPNLTEWARHPSRVAQNFRALLDLLDERNVKVTCFFLGWVAERSPELVREAADRGHEIASHGYAHELAYTLSPEAFLADISRAKVVIEQAAGRPVRGYRCPGFSVTAATPWFFDQVAAAGYTYDSSVFPAERGHGGLKSDHLAPYVVPTKSGPLVEFPITVAEVMKKRVCFFGGGYLRLFPYPLVKEMGRRVERERRPVVFYVHPREIDPEQPRLEMPPLRRFKSYVNLTTTKDKLRNIMADFQLVTFERYLALHPVVA